jgi:hypothetical protein
MTAITSRRLTESADSLLRLAMRADAVLTGLAGVAGIGLASQMSSLSGLSAGTERAIGVGFVLYGLVVFGLAALPSVRRAGVGVVIANIVYTIAAVVVVLAGWLPLTTTGVVLTLASGVYTAIFADLQYVGVRRLRA